jgi:AraC-like DNA-binding protein
LRGCAQWTTIVIARDAADAAIGFRDVRVACVKHRKRNAMEIGVRDDWIDRVVTACASIGTEAVARRARSARHLLSAFEQQLPPATSRAERMVLRAMLIEVALRWGHADHWAYHAEFPDADCAEDPSSIAMTAWHDADADALATFRAWAEAFSANMERVHPRYRATELRRELDADFAKPLSLTRLARVRCVSRRCLQRDFEELTGATIQEYVTERRLDAAVKLLQNTPDKVEWIANVVGWSSRKNFNRALIRKRGVNPADFRNRSDR